MSDKLDMIFNMLLIKVADDNSWRAGVKDNKHHLFEADENLERALQYFFQYQNLNNISESARDLPAHENTQGLKWPLLAQAGAITPRCLGLSPQTQPFSLRKRHHVYKVKLKQENIEPGQRKTSPGKRLGLTPPEPSRVCFLKKKEHK